jgi:LacI family transcriptional regulator
MAKPTIAQIAKEAKLGTATVERVLNGRSGVRPETAKRVVKAMRALGATRPLPPILAGLHRIDVLLVRPETAFFARLAQAFARIASPLDRSITVHRTFLDEADPEAIAHRIANPPFPVSAIICALPDHPAIRDALAACDRSGIPIVQIVSCPAPGHGDFVGIENGVAGRMAAHFMGAIARLRGPVIVISHSRNYAAHRERVDGFIAEARANDIRDVTCVHGHDDDVATASALGDALSAKPDCIGVYNAGGAVAAMRSVLRKHGLEPGAFVVAHEFDQTTRAGLAEGAFDIVIDQMPEAQARRAMDIVLSRIGFSQVKGETSPIHPTIHTRLSA